jgi:NAD(P) transhydrogenase subunit alpha
VITTAQLFGKRAPVVVTAAMLARMKPGAVVVDYAVESGGNVEGSRPGEEVELGGVRVIGLRNYPGRVAVDASRMLASNLAALVEEIWDKESRALNVDLSNEILAGCVVTHGGEVVHPLLKQKEAAS